MPSTPKPSSSLFTNKGQLTAYHAPTERQTAVRRSRCCSPNLPEMRWHSYWLVTHKEVVEVRDWLAALPISIQESLVGEIEDRLDAAASGTLDPSHPDEPIKCVASQPDLFELRWTLEPESGPARELRQYHGEPVGEPSLLIAAHIHFKSGETLSETQQLQNQSMAQAAHRYCHGGPSQWGCAGKTPLTSPIESLGF